MIVEHDFLIWIKNKQNVDRFLIFARSLMNFFEESIFFLKKYLKKFKIITNIIIIAFSKVNFFAATKK
ncbi:hypothetical protein APD05_00830 [Acinetobacter nosocomialis]|nr:hypothetical protein APD05_00830 [Acinetobacter nosocomialis]